MNTFSTRHLVPVLTAVSALVIACSSVASTGEGTLNTPASTPETSPATASAGSQTFLIPNLGDGRMEGHTPRGFRGSGTGLFAGDNLNRSFPNGDGVQFFLTFDLSDVPGREVVSAILHSENFSEQGTPFQDLGLLNVVEMRWGSFTPDLWDVEQTEGNVSCVFARSSAGPFECDLASAVQRSLDDDYAYAQFRLRFDRASDSDGVADLAAFFLTNSNTNEPGIFELVVQVVPSP